MINQTLKEIRKERKRVVVAKKSGHLASKSFERDKNIFSDSFIRAQSEA
jgi:hypothetical protein